MQPSLMPELGADDRLLVVAPHPDDESLAASGVLQRAHRLGATVRILFLTDGENNPWAQRATEMRVVIRREDRRRFGARRREEVAAALTALGLDGTAATFAGLPDQGLTTALIDAPGQIVAPIRAALEQTAPTIIVHPSMRDLHPDHSATAVAVDVALRRSAHPTPLRLPYLIHQPVVKTGGTSDLTALALDDEEIEGKRLAILAHRTQHRLRGPWLLAFAKSQETFEMRDPADADPTHPVRGVALAAGGIELEIESHSQPRAFGKRTIALAFDAWPRDEILGARISLPTRNGEPACTDGALADRLDGARWTGRGGSGRLWLPWSRLPAGATVYAKVLRRFGFFDEAGWCRILPSRPRC